MNEGKVYVMCPNGWDKGGEMLSCPVTADRAPPVVGNVCQTLVSSK